jgi:chemotaxis protein CheC
MNLTPSQTDVLTELINIGVGRAAGMLNDLTEAYVRLQVPFVRAVSPADFKQEMAKEGVDRLAGVQLAFEGPFFGTAGLVFAPESAMNLVALLTGEAPGTPELESVKVGTLNELGNIVINGVMGSMGNLLGQQIEYSLPSYIEDTVDHVLASGGADTGRPILLGRARFMIEQFKVEGEVILLFEMGSFESLLASVDAISASV